jgi:hypothetical protein
VPEERVKLEVIEWAYEEVDVDVISGGLGCR